MSSGSAAAEDPVEFSGVSAADDVAFVCASVVLDAEASFSEVVESGDEPLSSVVSVVRFCTVVSTAESFPSLLVTEASSEVTGKVEVMALSDCAWEFAAVLPQAVWKSRTPDRKTMTICLKNRECLYVNMKEHPFSVVLISYINIIIKNRATDKSVERGSHFTVYPA